MNSSRKVVKRVQLEKRKVSENGLTFYEYVYEVTDSEGKKFKRVVKQKVSSSKVPRFNQEENHDVVMNLIKKYFEDNQINVEDLHKMTTLQEILKPIRDYIINEIYIRVNLPILKNLIKTEILKIEDK